MNYLIDTSVTTRLHLTSIRDALVTITEQGLVHRTALTELEIGFSARSGNEWLLGDQGLSIFTSVAIHHDDFLRAKPVQHELATSGHRGRPVPELIIAAVGERLNSTVLHYDRYFDLIARVTNQPTAWIVPAGSIP